MMNLANLGMSLIPMNPLVGGIATGTGLLADILMAGQARKQGQEQLARSNEQFFSAQPDPYKAQTPRLAMGGLVPTDPPVKKRFEQRMNDPEAPFITNPDGTRSTHRMASAEVDGRFLAYPTIVMRGDSLAQLGDDEALKYALDNNEYREFSTDQDARRYAEGGYKEGTMLGRKWTPPISFAQGGAVPAGHVVPVDGTSRALVAGAQAGYNLGGSIIPGGDHGRADDKLMTPNGGSQVAISSGEMYVPNNVFQGMSSQMNVPLNALIQQLYPDGQNAASAQTGMSVPQAEDPMAPYRNMLASIGANVANIGGVGTMERAAQPSPQAPSVSQPALRTGPAAGPGADQTNMTDAQKKANTTQLPGPNAEEKSGGMNPLDKINQTSAIAQGVLGAGMLAYNLFSKRAPLPKPAEMPFQPLDLRTDALATELDAQRQESLAGAVRNTQNKQGVGRDMAIAAQDQSVRRSNTAQVEQVKNQERQYNNASSNAVAQANVQQQNQYAMANAQANNQFRQMKGQATTMAIGQLGQTAQSYFQNKMDIQTNEQMKRSNRIYLAALAGDPRYANLNPSQIYLEMNTNDDTE